MERGAGGSRSSGGLRLVAGTGGLGVLGPPSEGEAGVRPEAEAREDKGKGGGGGDGLPDRVEALVDCEGTAHCSVYAPRRSMFHDRDEFQAVFREFVVEPQWLKGKIRVSRGGWSRATSQLRPEVRPVWIAGDPRSTYGGAHRDSVAWLMGELQALDARNVPRDGIFKGRRVRLYCTAIRYGTMSKVLENARVDPDDYFLGLESVEVVL